MDVPCRQDDDAEPFGPGSHPKRGLLLDVGKQQPWGGLGVVEHTTVPVFPDHPWHQEGDGG